MRVTHDRARHRQPRKGPIQASAAMSVLGLSLILAAASPSTASSARSDDPVIAAAGDIACGPGSNTPSSTRCQQEATSDLLVSIGPGVVLPLGDAQYPSGGLFTFRKVYDPTWGRLLERTRPVPGNHEYRTDGASGYYTYFGSRAGDPEKGYYSFDLANWHIIALNTECSEVGGCWRRTPQGSWLRSDLAAHPSQCILAYWHRPLFSSSSGDRSSTRSRYFWRELQRAGADVVLTAHAHNYERFVPQDALGNPDPNGIRQFVVGTGGKSLHGFDSPLPTTAVRDNDTFGVLELSLHSDSYSWEFVPASVPGGGTFTDSGSDTC